MRFAFRRRSLLTVTLVAALALACIAVVSSAVGQDQRVKPAPSLALTHRSPATVDGHHFKAASRVKVTLILARRWARTVTPGVAGGFTVSFPVAIDRCGPWSVTAVQGAHQVLLRGPAKPMCAPAGAP